MNQPHRRTALRGRLCAQPTHSRSRTDKVTRIADVASVAVRSGRQMTIAIRALTSTDDHEISDCLVLLKSSHAGTGFMHEAFWKDDAAQFTRAWFAWANALFGELILTLSRERPHLL